MPTGGDARRRSWAVRRSVSDIWCGWPVRNSLFAMSTRSFAGLSPLDFETLMRDLLWQHWGVRVESFMQGRDQGIDLRVMVAMGKGRRRLPHLPPTFLRATEAGRPTRGTQTIIVQCKHYEKSGYDKLKSKLREELPKVEALSPTKYLLATTVGLTPERKSELAGILKPWCKSDDDILGADDIDGLLAQYPDVEKHNFKLWLNSVGVLERVLHNDIVSRTAGYREDLERQARIYVQNESYSEARTILGERRVCIISGAPGVGKTTLANILVMRLIDEGFEPVFVAADAGEADRLYRSAGKQVFVYDDFLGRTSGLEKLTKNEDDKLLRLITRIQRDPSKRFILTTREYILQQARQWYERLGDRRIDLVHYILDIGVYTRMVRAQILYNHLYFSLLPDEAKKSFVDSRVYHRIINHPNYNPRLIEDTVDLAIFGNVASADVSSFFLESFDKPARLWAHVFSRQLDAAQRAILALLITLDPPAKLNDLERAYERVSVEFGASGQFEVALRGIEASAIRILGPQADQEVDYANPGVQDAVVNALSDGVWRVSDLVRGCTWFGQLITLWSYSREPVRSGDVSQQWESRTDYRRRSRHIFIPHMMRRPLVQDLAFPKLRAKVLECREELVAALLRTIYAEVNRDRSAEWRVYALLTVIEDLGCELSQTEMERIAGWLIERWRNGVGHKDAANDLLSLMGGLKMRPVATVRSALASAALDWMSGRRGLVFDLASLATLLDTLDTEPYQEVDSFDDHEREEFKADFVRVLQDETRQLLEVEPSDSVIDELDVLDAMASDFGLDSSYISNARAQIEVNVSESIPENEDERHDEYSPPTDPFAAFREKRVIDEIFGTLEP